MCMCVCMHMSQGTPGSQKTTFGKSVLSYHLGSKDWTSVIRNLLSPVEVILSIILWNDTLHFFFVLFCFLRWGLFILSCLSWSLLCKPGWLQSHRGPSASAFWVLGLKVWTTVRDLTSHVCVFKISRKSPQRHSVLVKSPSFFLFLKEGKSLQLSNLLYSPLTS